jgi:hypothetical protein
LSKAILLGGDLGFSLNPTPIMAIVGCWITMGNRCYLELLIN